MAKPPLKELSRPPVGAHVAACGLFCSNCKRFRAEKCRGCQIAPIFRSCPVRLCCESQDLTGCWECRDFKDRDYQECNKVNNRVSRIISFFTKSDRAAALATIRDRGLKAFIESRKISGKM
jgi:hypothetical protein